MELQIRSTLNVLRSAIADESIQIHGLRYLITLNSHINEQDILNCPIVETVLLSLKTFSKNDIIKKLGYSVLIAFSHLSSCIEDAEKFGLIQNVSQGIALETDPKVISLELAVISSYGVHKRFMEVLQSSEVFSAIARIEVKWSSNPIVFQQYLGVLMVLSANKYTHHDILQLNTIRNIADSFSSFSSSFEIIRGMINICYNLASSKEGKYFLYTNRILSKIAPVFAIHPCDPQLSCCLSKLLIALNQEKSYRREVVSTEGCKLAVLLLTSAQSAEVAREAMLAMRSICSAEQDSISAVVGTNCIQTIHATVKRFVEDEGVCTHGVRALEWILQAGQSTIVRTLIDAGTIALCSDLLDRYHTVDLTRFVCGCLIKIQKYTMNISYVVQHLKEHGVLLRVKGLLTQFKLNESLTIEYCKLLAALCSSREALGCVVEAGLMKPLVVVAGCCQTPDAAMLVTGILWKACLEEEGRRQILQANGVDGVLKLLQQFMHNAVIHRNGLGCLSLLIQGSSSVCDVIRRRLGLSLVFDTMENFAKNPEYCIQVLTFLQYMSMDANCYRVMLDHCVCSHVLEVLRVQQQNITVSTMCFVLLDSLLGEDEGLYQLCSQEGVGELLKKVIANHEANQPDVGKLGNDVLKKLSLFNNAL